MQFQSPWVLLWFLPVAGFILFLYLLKVRRREVRVPAKFLWPPITTDVRANALFQKLRPNLLLFLQLLMALLVITALARPMMMAKGLPGRSAIVIDTSASMGAREGNTTRFEQARNRVRALVRDLNPGEQVALIEAGAQVRVAASLTADKQKLLSAIESLRLTDTGGNIAEALRLASALVGGTEGGRIILLSDGAFPPVEDFSPGKAKLVYEAFGQNTENCSITAMEVQERSEGYEWFVALRNFGKQPAKGVLEFYSGGKLVNAREVSLPAGQTVGQTFMARQLQEPLEARLVLQDALEADNRAYRVGITEQTVRVLLVGEGNFFLERALVLEPNVQVEKAPSVPDTERAEHKGEGRYQLVIFDRVPPVPVKAQAVMVIRAQGGPIAKLGEKVASPRFAVWEREHPLLRYLALEPVLIDSAPKLTPAPWAQVIAESEQTPLIVAGEHQRKRWVGVGWDFLESDFPLQPAFPIFVANLIRWSIGDQGSPQGITVRTGSPFSLTLPGNPSEAQLMSQDGSASTYRVNEGSLLHPGILEVGLYTLKAGRASIPIAANLFDSDESDIAPRTTLQLGGRTVQAQGEMFTLRDWWRPIVLVMLAVLMLEWWVFVKRS